MEVLSESLFKFGHGAKILTEPLVAWFTGPQFQQVLTEADGGRSSALSGPASEVALLMMVTDPSDEVVALTKLLAALVEHSSEWLIAKIARPEVQSLLGLVLRLTGWEGTGGVDEQVSEVRHRSSLSTQSPFKCS